MLNLQNIQDAKRKLLNSNPYDFTGNIQNGFVDYLRKIEVDEFRHIKNLEIEFKHPVTVISGTNAIGKTSILLLIACSHVEFKKYDSTKPERELRRHKWGDVISFTAYETANNNLCLRQLKVYYFSKIISNTFISWNRQRKSKLI